MRPRLGAQAQVSSIPARIVPVVLTTRGFVITRYGVIGDAVVHVRTGVNLVAH